MLKIIVLEGDETGQELLEQAVRVLDPDLLGIELELVRYDLSLQKRRETGNEIVHEAARAMREAGFGIKAATVTPEGRDDVGSPNRILREEVGGKVIVRTGRRIPGVVGPVSGVFHPIAVVRMAIEDAYGAKQWREGSGDGEVAYRTEKVTRSTCGAIAGAESVLLAFDEDYEVDVAMAEAPHGTAPSLMGKDLANPMAMLLACGAVLSYAAVGGVAGAERASRAVYEGVLETVATGVRTIDLGGHATTTEFTDAVVDKVRTKVDVWASLGSR